MMSFILRPFKYINAMPFPFSMRHYQIFGDSTKALEQGALDSKESWELLRAEHPFFSISHNREEWLKASELQIKKDGQDARLIERAQDIVTLLRQKEITSLFSVGCGGAGLEYQIKKHAPDIQVVCSDYSQSTVDALKEVFLESDGIMRFDIREGDWEPINAQYIGERGVCMIYRVDASFDDKEWQTIFARMAEAGVAHILVIPTGTLTILSIYNRKRRELVWHLKRIPVAFAGYLRTASRFKSHWREGYVQESFTLGGLKSFFLSRHI